jgi:hypothetical protein
MWEKSYSKLFKGLKKEKVWDLWVDVNNWPKWHGDLEYCKMEGEFVVGNYFMLKPQGISAVKIVLTHVENGHQFTDCTSFFGAKMYDTHIIAETMDGLLLTNKLVVKGPLSPLWIKLVAQNVAASVPQEMEALAKLAGEHHG